MKIAGLVLAAGAGRRMGTPKALIRDTDGTPWAARAARLLTDSGCAPVVVVIGAAADQVRAELSAESAAVVEALDWQEGMSASLRTGLKALQSLPTRGPAAAGVDAVVVVPVDVPGLTVGAVRRVVEEAGAGALVRATYDGTPGHPVVIGREHWDGVIASAHGDEGARGYLRAHDVVLVECGDIGDGADVDTVEELPPGHA